MEIQRSEMDIDRATSTFAASLTAILKATYRRGLADGQKEEAELLDQYNSGLGRRHHCRAWREGKLQGRKVGRRVLITREDRDRYLKEYGAPGALIPAGAADIDSSLDRELRSLGFDSAAGKKRTR